MVIAVASHFKKSFIAMIFLRSLLIASTSAIGIFFGVVEIAFASASAFNPDPIFKDVASFTTTISANNQPADIYFPNLPNLDSRNLSFPTVLLLQGLNVDKSNYSGFASLVAGYGFVVVVPNNVRSLPPFGTALIPETSLINDVLTQIRIENANSTSPIFGIANPEKLALLGHSAGGAVGLSAIANLCLPFLCEGSFERPKELVAGAFYGPFLESTGESSGFRDPTTGAFIPLNNSGIPTALLQGTLDGIAPPQTTKEAYEQIQYPPKTLIGILGANHYGITNTNNPVGAPPDPNRPAIAQATAVETITRWSGLFLRASALNDRQAALYVFFTGDAHDQNVITISQPCLSQFLPWPQPCLSGSSTAIGT
jgi:pimeloyl-ACP methyl ester carboxylesterase